MKDINTGMHVTSQPLPAGGGSGRDIYSQIQRAAAVRYNRNGLKNNPGLSREHRRSIALRAYKSKTSSAVLRESGMSARV